MHQPPTRGEELPPEEFDGLPDWNAQAWQAIQARDAKRVPVQQLPAHLATLSDAALAALHAAVGDGPEDAAMGKAVAAELAHREQLERGAHS